MITPPPVVPRRVLVVHADPALRRSVVQGLRSRGVPLVVEVGTAPEARLVMRSPGPRDLAMVQVADTDGWAVLDELRRAGWAPVVAMPSAAEVRLVSAAFDRDASGVLFPASDRAAPPAAGPVPPAVLRPVPDVSGVPQALTHRELQILQFAADGMTNSEIGDELGISPLTIKSHLGRIARRLGSGERAQLVLLALRSGAIG